MLTRKHIYFFVLLTSFFVSSCKNEMTAPTETEVEVIYSRPGLVDSAVVYGCYPRTDRFFIDTLHLETFRKLKVEFDGYANSDGSYIKVFYNTSSASNIEVYSAEDVVEVNKLHSFVFSRPDNAIWMELRIYINPPVCGQGEFKFTRARDLNIYGLR